jgi:hypothetical protein
MAGIEEAFEKFVTRVSSRERSPAEQPLSKYKSYSEQELLENIEAKYPNQLQSFSQEDYQLNTMPMFEPKNVAPPRSYSPMPVEKYLRGKEYMDLAEGGVASMFRERPGYQVGGTIDPFALQRSPIDQYGYSDPVISALTGNIFTSGQRFRDVFSPQAGLMMQQAQAAGYSEPEMEELRQQQDLFPSFQRSLNEAYFGPTFQANPQTSTVDLATAVRNLFLNPQPAQQQFMQQPQTPQTPQTQSPQLSYNEIQKADYARRMGELENKFAKQGTSSTKYIQDMTNLLAQMKTSGGIDPLGAMQSKYYTGPSSGSVSEGRGIDANFVINRAQQSEREAAARVTPTRMADGGRVSMSEGGLTTTIPPAKGPDSQGVESLFRRRYS